LIDNMTTAAPMRRQRAKRKVGAPPASLADLALMARPALLASLDTSSTSLDRALADGSVPPGIRIGKRCTRWPAGEIRAVLEAIAAGATIEERRALVVRLVAARRGKQQ
jgi:predicted DNA-binding transcriptional regulator AlpA